MCQGVKVGVGCIDYTRHRCGLASLVYIDINACGTDSAGQTTLHIAVRYSV